MDRSKKNEFLIGSKNGTCFGTFADLLAQSKADVYLGQEIGSVGENFWKIKSRLLSGRYIFDDEDPTEQISNKWRGEGTASLEGPNGGRSAGNITCVKPHIDIAPPTCDAYDSVSKRNRYRVSDQRETSLGLLRFTSLSFWQRELYLPLRVPSHQGIAVATQARS